MKNVTSVLHKHSSLEELVGLDLDHFPEIRSIFWLEIPSLRRATALLALRSRAGLPIGSKGDIWYKYKAMEKLTTPSGLQI
jgi:hypothetical protein